MLSSLDAMHAQYCCISCLSVLHFWAINNDYDDSTSNKGVTLKSRLGVIQGH